VHQVGNQSRLYYDARSVIHQDQVVNSSSANNHCFLLQTN